MDTSDAAYEKRHRKYESFEKRQRLREKEKLKHEHYKLKERIDQLRGMDTAAFLAIPASEFAEARRHTPGGAGAAADEPAAVAPDSVDAFSLNSFRREVMRSEIVACLCGARTAAGLAPSGFSLGDVVYWSPTGCVIGANRALFGRPQYQKFCKVQKPTRPRLRPPYGSWSGSRS